MRGESSIQTSTDHRIATGIKMRSEYLVYKSFFGFALNMDEQFGHFAEKMTVSNIAKKNKVASAMNRKEPSEETGGRRRS